MIEIEVEGNLYRVVKLPAWDQFKILRKAAPVISAVAGAENTAIALGEAVGNLSDSASDAVMAGLLSCVSRKVEGGSGWAPISRGTTLAYQDLTLSGMMKLAQESWNSNFTDFLDGLAGSGDPASPNITPPVVG